VFSQRKWTLGLQLIKKETLYDKIHTVRAMQNDMKTESQTAYMGTSWLLTLCHRDENGIAPSLEKA